MSEHDGISERLSYERATSEPWPALATTPVDCPACAGLGERHTPTGWVTCGLCGGAGQVDSGAAEDWLEEHGAELGKPVNPDILSRAAWCPTRAELLATEADDGQVTEFDPDIGGWVTH